MTKIYEALQNASRERGESGAPRVSLPAATPSRALEEKLVALYHRIEPLMEGRQGRLVEFAGVHAGDDGSRIAAEFAKLAALRLDRRVLILTVGSFTHLGRVGSSAAVTWEQVLRNEAALDDAIQAMGAPGIFVSQVAASDAALAIVLDSPRLPDLLTALRGRFDLILMDPPPFGAGPDAALLAGIADGVVLVVEAEKTRWQVVRQAIEEIQARRGNVLGVILNKCRYYIPNAIYRRLL